MRQAIDPFFTTKPPERGSGRGLSMVHGFAAQSGGTLHLTSKQGKGTTATIVLPLSTAPVSGLTSVERDASVTCSRILLVDDEDAVRRTTAEMLRGAGQDVVEASNVDEALHLLRNDPRVDAIITDFIMPGRSGGDLIKAVKRD